MQATETEGSMDVPYHEILHREFWRAAQEGRLLVRRCTKCGKLHWYPRTLCPYCFGQTCWEQASGRGVIYSLAVDRTGSEKVAVAYVRLEEGVTLLTNILASDPDALKIDDPVHVAFRPGPDGVLLQFFKPTH